MRALNQLRLRGLTSAYSMTWIVISVSIVLLSLIGTYLLHHAEVETASIDFEKLFANFDWFTFCTMLPLLIIMIDGIIKHRTNRITIYDANRIMEYLRSVSIQVGTLGTTIGMLCALKSFTSNLTSASLESMANMQIDMYGGFLIALQSTAAGLAISIFAESYSHYFIKEVGHGESAE